MHTCPRRRSQIIDSVSLYLNNCVLGVSLFNFGLFCHMNGIISCSRMEARRRPQPSQHPG